MEKLDRERYLCNHFVNGEACFTARKSRVRVLLMARRTLTWMLGAPEISDSDDL